jgi:hypothetical protein
LKRKVCKHAMTLKKARATIRLFKEHAGLNCASTHSPVSTSPARLLTSS